MLAYLVKCATIQAILLFAQWFQMLPWTLTINVAVIVVVPMLIAAGAWRVSKQTVLRNLADDLGADLTIHQSEIATQDRH